MSNWYKALEKGGAIMILISWAVMVYGVFAESEVRWIELFSIGTGIYFIGAILRRTVIRAQSVKEKRGLNKTREWQSLHPKARFISVVLLTIALILVIAPMPFLGKGIELNVNVDFPPQIGGGEVFVLRFTITNPTDVTLHNLQIKFTELRNFELIETTRFGEINPSRDGVLYLNVPPHETIPTLEIRIRGPTVPNRYEIGYRVDSSEKSGICTGRLVINVTKI